MAGKKKKLIAAKAQAITTKKAAARKSPSNHFAKEDRRAKKLEQRRKEKKLYTAREWAAPAPSHLVARLDLPKVKSKHQSYFEFADNPERKQKKLEFEVDSDVFHANNS